MSTTRGVRTLVGLTLASSAFLLGGCASSGTVAAGSSGGATSADTASKSSAPASSASSSDSAASSSSSSSDTSASDSSSSSDSSGSSGGGLGGGADAGCTAAATDVANGGQAVSGLGADPAKAVAAIKGIGDKLHTDAGKSSGAAAASINKLADDYIGLANSVSKGQMPDTSSLMTDAQAMMKACGY